MGGEATSSSSMPETSLSSSSTASRRPETSSSSMASLAGWAVGAGAGCDAGVDGGAIDCGRERRSVAGGLVVRMVGGRSGEV